MRYLFSGLVTLVFVHLSACSIPLVFNLSDKKISDLRSIKEVVISKIKEQIEHEEVRYKKSKHLALSYYNKPNETIILEYETLTAYCNVMQRKRLNDYMIVIDVESTESEETGEIRIKITRNMLTIQAAEKLDTEDFYDFIDVIEKIIIEVGNMYGGVNTRQLKWIKKKL